MPKSKRNKQVELSKASKHGMDLKKRLHEEIRSCVDSYSNVFVFSVTDMRNSKLKSVRNQWRHSRFFIGKNKVMAIAFGRSPEEEYKTNLHQIGTRMKGQCGILFSNKSKDEVITWFSSYSEGDFARSGNIATERVFLPEGPLPNFPHSLEPYLRGLGLPTTMKKGVIHLLKDYEVCQVGDKLTPETARILKLLGYEMAEFHINVDCVWSNNGEFEDFGTTLDTTAHSISDDAEEEKNDNIEDVLMRQQKEDSEASAEINKDDIANEDLNEDKDMDVDISEVKSDETNAVVKDDIVRADTSVEKSGELNSSNPASQLAECAKNIDTSMLEHEDLKNDDPKIQSNEIEDESEDKEAEEEKDDDVDSDAEKANIVNALKNDSKIFSSPDEKSPVFRSLRNRTIKIPKNKKKSTK